MNQQQASLKQQMGISHQNSTQKIISRGKIQIIYSTTSLTSKSKAQQLQQLLEEQQYFVNLSNISQYPIQYYQNYQGTIIFLLSTYGDGDSPEDGQKFYNWVTNKDINVENQFSQLKYIILALGNKTFDNFCGFGVKTNNFLQRGGGRQLFELTLCDANSKEQDISSIFPLWSKSIIQRLNSINEKKQFEKTNLVSSLVANLSKCPQNFDWENIAKKITNLDHFIQGYLNLYTSKVEFIKELRKKNDGRSSLWVRLNVDESFKLSPGCNIEIFPKNKIVHSSEDDMFVNFNEIRGRFPFPPIPLKQLRKLININQNASRKHIKSAILYSQAEEAAKQYKVRLDNKQEIIVSCKKLIEELKPKPQFYCLLGLNAPRIYTLASWNPENSYIDLCVSLVDGGLTSEYLKTYPSYVKIKSIQSNFYFPQNKPIIMIANGSGIAPFRSLCMYVSLLPIEKRSKIQLYYGIQHQKNDYYFQQDWKDLQQKGILQVFLAQSRNQQVKKEYVQNLLQNKVQYLKQHIFDNKGVIFICGGKGMYDAIDKIIFKSIQMHSKVPYKAFTMASTLKQNKTIVAQVFG